MAKRRVKIIKKTVQKEKKRPLRRTRKKFIIRERDFETFVLWKSLPAFLKGKTEEEIKNFGFTEDCVVELLSLKNKTEFAKKFKVCADTLTDWNKKIEDSGLATKRIMLWAKKLTPNVIGGFYTKSVKEADAARVKLWLQFVEGWNETVKHKGIVGIVPGDDIEKLTDEQVKKRVERIRVAIEAIDS